MNKPRSGDVRVIGLVAGTHIIEDIGMDVPHGVTVTIPGDMAIRSKDLWRGISQKCLFQLPSAAPPPGQYLPATPAVSVIQPDPDRPRLEARIRELENKVLTLEVENRLLRELRGEPQGTQNRDSKIDSILEALQNATLSGPRPMFGGGTSRKEEVADGTAPTFLPSEIRMRDADVRIDIQGESSTTSDVSGAAERLRKMRQGS